MGFRATLTLRGPRIIRWVVEVVVAAGVIVRVVRAAVRVRSGVHPAVVGGCV